MRTEKEIIKEIEYFNESIKIQIKNDQSYDFSLGKINGLLFALDLEQITNYSIPETLLKEIDKTTDNLTNLLEVLRN